MFKAVILNVIFCFWASTLVFAQSDSLNQYGLYIISSIEKFKQTVEKDSSKQLVRIKDYVPNVVLDIKYATTQNVFYTKLYDRSHAYMRLPAAKALALVQKELNESGLGLKIYDAYRPYSVTCHMFEMIPDTNYMGLPWTGSKHNRGVALDLTLIDLKTRQELRMPTPFDALVYASHPQFMGLPDSVIQNREKLKIVMQKHGFVVDPMEWWHFNYTPNKGFELLDLPPADIEKLQPPKKRKK
jgi:zinc D-Ala-D-Ala dipeptidase